MVIVALVVFIIGTLLNLFSIPGWVSVPHLNLWDWTLLFAGLALCVASGVPVPWRR